MRNDAKAPNYFGIGGAVLTAMGMFMPLVEMWSYQVTLAKFFQTMTGGGSIFTVITLALLAFAAYRFFIGEDEGRWVGVVLLVAFLFLLFFDPDSGSHSIWYDIAENFTEISYGLWVILIGFGLMIAAPSLTGLRENQKNGSTPIADKYQEAYRYEAPPKPVPVSPLPAWTCPRCKNINSGMTKICFVCKQEKPALKTCPFCGAETAHNSVFCANCGTKLETAKEEVQEKPSIPKNVLGVWDSEQNSNGLPERELVISSVEDDTLTFDLVQYAGYKLEGQTAVLGERGVANFRTTDGTGVNGAIAMNIENIVVYIDESSYPGIEAGDVYTFISKSESRQL